MAKAQRPTPEVVASIAEQSAAVRQAAAELTAKITDFKEFLSKLKGRVEAVAYGSFPGEEEVAEESLGIRLGRVEKEWELEWAYVGDDYPEQPATYAPLGTAPLEIKVAAIRWPVVEV